MPKSSKKKSLKTKRNSFNTSRNQIMAKIKKYQGDLSRANNKIPNTMSQISQHYKSTQRKPGHNTSSISQIIPKPHSKSRKSSYSSPIKVKLNKSVLNKVVYKLSNSKRKNPTSVR